MRKPGIRFALLVALIWLFCVSSGKGDLKEENDIEDEIFDSEPLPKTESSLEDEFELQYVTPTLNGPAYFSEHFDDPDVARKRWLISRAQKEEQDNVFKYDGEWDFMLPQKVVFNGDRALVLKSKAKHAAIAAKLDKKFDFNTKPLFVQYEVNFQNGIDCGGAYIKLLSYSPNIPLEKFHDKTPYSIMFGPDKCGNDYKLHFIFRHKNPLNGTFEEKHAKRPSNRLEENYSDKKSHLYLLKLHPDNTFQIFVDGALINSGSLLEDMTPPVNPPLEIEDSSDKKPSSWDERETIPDAIATKPDDWDEDAPHKIPDSNAVKPDGWLDNDVAMLPDTTAVKPEDWDDSMDGEWEPPLISNPVCEGAPGCGPWTASLIENPSFKGKWKPPMISNPSYQGKWSPKKIPNPDYFDDKEPFKMASIGAVGIEIWAMTDLILFDNFVITDSEKVLEDWTSKTYDLKRQAINRDSEGVISRIVSYSNAHPWLWAVYVVVIGLPVVLFFVFCCGSSQDKKSEAARHKKTDEITEDDEELAEEALLHNDSSVRMREAVTKEELEESKDNSDDNENDDDEDEESGDGDGDQSGGDGELDDEGESLVPIEEKEVENDMLSGGGDAPRKRRARRD